MLKTKHLFLLMPFFVFISLFLVACTPPKNEIEDENVYPLLCKFEDSTPVILSANDVNNEATVKLIVEGENITVKPEISYNDEIISYNETTGKIVAISEGSTSIIVLYQTSKQVYKQIYLNVNVVDSIFATSVVLNNSYKFKIYENTKSAKIVPYAVTRESNYSHGFIFESLSPEVFEVSDEGDVMPLSEGVGILKVSAISGYNAQLDTYSYVSATTQIIVELPIENFSLDVVDKDFNTILSTSYYDKNYDLYYGKKYGQDAENKYYFKIECSKVLTDNLALHRDFKGTNLINDGASLHYLLSGGESCDAGRTIYIPFAVRDAGVESVTYSCLDVALNYYNELKSNTISFNSIPYMTDLSVSCISYAGEENVLENLYTVSKNPTTGNYTLYLLSGTDEDITLGQSAGYANYVNISFSNINIYALNKLTVEYDGGILPEFDVLEHSYKVVANSVGQTTVNLVANDESGWTKTLVFDVVKLNPTSYQLKQFKDNKISLVCGVNEFSSVCLDLISYAPSYASVDVSLQPAVVSGNNPISINGTTISANSKGQCYVVLFINEERKITYLVTIENTPTKIVLFTPTIVNMEVGGNYEMLFSLQDDDGAKISLVDLNVVVLDENDNVTNKYNEFLFIDKRDDGAGLIILKKGIYKLRIQTVQGSLIYEDITVLCI